jgi:hypothetical protein
MIDYRLNAESGSFRVTGSDAQLRHVMREAVWKKNWPLIVSYAGMTVVGVIASYFVSGWISVTVSAFVALATFGVGLRMLQEVITTTVETR